MYLMKKTTEQQFEKKILLKRLGRFKENLSMWCNQGRSQTFSFGGATGGARMVCVGLSERDLENFGGATGGPGKIFGGAVPPWQPPSSAPGCNNTII